MADERDDFLDEKKILRAEEKIEDAQDRIEAEEEKIFRAEKVILENLSNESSAVLASKNPRRKLHYLHQFLKFRLSHHTVITAVLLTLGVFLIWHALSEIVMWLPIVSNPFGALVIGIVVIWFVGHNDETFKK